MGTLSGDGYYQDKDEDAYYDSWEFARDQDRLDGIERPDSDRGKRLANRLRIAIKSTKLQWWEKPSIALVVTKAMSKRIISKPFALPLKSSE